MRPRFSRREGRRAGKSMSAPKLALLPAQPCSPHVPARPGGEQSGSGSPLLPGVSRPSPASRLPARASCSRRLCLTWVSAWTQVLPAGSTLCPPSLWVADWEAGAERSGAPSGLHGWPAPRALHPGLEPGLWQVKKQAQAARVCTKTGTFPCDLGSDLFSEETRLLWKVQGSTTKRESVASPRGRGAGAQRRSCPRRSRPGRSADALAAGRVGATCPAGVVGDGSVPSRPTFSPRSGGGR